MSNAQRHWVCAQCAETEGDERSAEFGETIEPTAGKSGLADASSLVCLNSNGLYICRCTPDGKTLH